jgi:hypothetical protein
MPRALSMSAMVAMIWAQRYLAQPIPVLPNADFYAADFGSDDCPVCGERNTLTWSDHDDVDATVIECLDGCGVFLFRYTYGGY